MDQERDKLEGLEQFGRDDEKALTVASTDLETDDDSSAQSEQLKNQIEETRAQMGETIDQIQEKLSFSNLSEQVSEHVNNVVDTAKEAVYDATIGKAAIMMKNIGKDISGTSIVKTVKDNPVPFIFIGLGAGMLAYTAMSGGSAKKGNRKLALAGRDPKGLSGDTESLSTGAVDKVTGAIGSAYETAGGAVGRAYSKAGDLGTAVIDQYDTYIESNPLAVGAVALAFGAAVGMAIPSTRYEGDLLGGVRSGVIDKVQATASDLIDTTKDAVADSAKSFAEQAKSSIM